MTQAQEVLKMAQASRKDETVLEAIWRLHKQVGGKITGHPIDPVVTYKFPDGSWISDSPMGTFAMALAKEVAK